MAERPQTLLQMQGAPLHPSSLSDASLIIIDLQEEYRSGALPLPGIEPAIQEAARVLEIARAAHAPVVHILHEIQGDAPMFNPSRPTYLEVKEVEARPGERTIVKRLPNAFAGTELANVLRATGRREIIVVGAQTHMCVSATVRAALDLGFRTTVVAKACATRDLPSGDETNLSAANVHRTALAELADVFAIVVPDAAALT